MSIHIIHSGMIMKAWEFAIRSGRDHSLVTLYVTIGIKRALQNSSFAWAARIIQIGIIRYSSGPA
jgi:uncharacterized membrane protein YgdD (TMEM256/DUF423 family)